MTKQETIRDKFVETLDHIIKIENTVSANRGRGGIFTFPDQHKIYEGLFLSAWTHWEEFIRKLLIYDLAEDSKGFVLKDIKKFRLKGAPYRLAERVLLHPDHPQKFVEWDYDLVKSRATELLSAGHRFTNRIPRKNDLDKLKRIRNAIAHKSDRARDSFLKLVIEPPFNLQARQRSGITVGRFLAAHEWNGKRIMIESVECLRQSALHLVP